MGTETIVENRAERRELERGIERRHEAGRKHESPWTKPSLAKRARTRHARAKAAKQARKAARA